MTFLEIFFIFYHLPKDPQYDLFVLNRLRTTGIHNFHPPRSDIHESILNMIYAPMLMKQYNMQLHLL